MTGKREYGLAESSASASAIGVDASIVTSRRRGVMISRTTRLVTERAPASISRSSESISPPAALSRYRPASSVGECTWEWEWSTWSPSRRMMANAEPLKTATSGRSSHWLIRIGVSVAIANVSGYRSATVLGSNSPSTTWSDVMNSSTTTTASVGLGAPEPLLEQRDELGLTVGAGDEARQRDADLAGGDVVVEPLGVLQDRQEALGRSAPRLGGLLDARAPGADGGELGRDVQRVEADHDEDEQQHDHGVHSKVDRTDVSGIPRHPQFP